MLQYLSNRFLLNEVRTCALLDLDQYTAQIVRATTVEAYNSILPVNAVPLKRVCLFEKSQQDNPGW